MKKIILFFLSAQSIAFYGQPTIFIVRHSEKVSNWPHSINSFTPLSEEGIETSQKLADYFSGDKLSAIYSSKNTRTIHTAFYTARNQSLEIQINDACSDTSKIKDFLAYIGKKFDDEDTLLIVSHSNIIPYFLIKSGLTTDRYDEMNITKSHSGWLLTDYYGEVFIVEQGQMIRRYKFTKMVE